jgi:hypothetical protein
MRKSRSQQIRETKHVAHRWFDALWKEGYMARHEAYVWLADQMNIPLDECHFTAFDLGMCEAAIWIVRHKVQQLRAKAKHYARETGKG